MQRMKHLFFIFSLILVFASSAWSVDLNCPGGTWVQVASCGYGGVRIDGTPSYPCGTSICLAACCSTGLLSYEEISGSIKKNYTYFRTIYALNQAYYEIYCNGCQWQTVYNPPICPPPPPAAASCNCTQPIITADIYVTRTYSESEWKCPCTGSETKSCYDGPAGTEGVGICRAGTQTCSNGWFGSCQGQVTPQTEICGDNQDNNCNGQIDEGCEPEELKKNLGSGNDKTNPATECGFSTANFSTGNLYKDYAISSGYLDLTLSYNSLDSLIGALGKGWNHTYTITLSYISNTSLILTEGDGKRVKYLSPDGVTYTPEERFGDASKITKNPDNTFFLRKKNGTVFTFSSDGRLASITDRNNNITTLTYTNGELTSITDPYGRTATLAYTSGKLTSIKDPLLREYTLSYTGDMLTSITDPEAGKTTYAYDANNRIISVQSPNAGITAYAYDTQGRILSSQDPLANTKSIQYIGTESKAIITDRNGSITTYTYDKDLNTIKQNIDPLGNITAYTYDTKGNLLTITHPDAATETYTYDTNNNPLTFTDRGGNTTTYAYEPNYNQITSITDPLGRKTLFTYDAKGNLITITDPLANTTTLAYSARGRITSITDAMGNTVTITYDAYGNISNIKDQLNNTTAFETDTIGNLKKTIDANANQTAYTYDNLNRLTALTNALSQITAFTYGQSCSGCGTGNNLTSIKDAKTNTTNFTYDLNNRLIKETDPLNNATTYTYDPNGNLITKIDANSNTITYTYDSLNRLTAKNYPDATKTTFTYDTMGNLITASNQNITYTYTYDNNGRMTSVTDSFGRVISYQYDTVGNKTKMTAPDGKITNYTYDSNNRLTQITADVTQSFSFAYDSLNRRTTLLFPNAIQTTYTYDAKANLTDITTQKAPSTGSGQAISTYKQTYQYDKTGNRTSYTEPSGIHNYTYDPTYQLVSADHTNIPDENYTYDPVGNRLNTTVDNANRLIEDQNHTYQYDNNGNLIQKTHKITGIITQYTYDFENRLIKITLPLGITAEYKYDPFGRRIEKNISSQITIKYLYDNEDIIMEYAAIIPTNTNITTKYIHGPGIDEPLSMIRNNKTYYYHADALGSITRMTDQNGNIAQTIKYDSFGNIKSISNPLLIQPYAWTAREYDIESGFYYLRNRYYDPRIGRFTTKDPIGFAGGDVNLYGYVGNGPTNWVDPDGLQLYPPLPLNILPPSPSPELPSCPPAKENCSQYPKGSLLYWVCMNGGDNPWSNCVRRCLKNYYQECSDIGCIIRDHITCWSICPGGSGGVPSL